MASNENNHGQALPVADANKMERKFSQYVPCFDIMLLLESILAMVRGYQSNVSYQQSQSQEDNYVHARHTFTQSTLIPYTHIHPSDITTTTN